MRSLLPATVGLVLFTAAVASAADLSVATHDGLALGFDGSGTLTSVSSDGASLPLLGNGGFFVSEVTSSDTPLPNSGDTRAGELLVGTATQSGANQITLTASSPSLGVNFTGVIEGGAAMQVHGRLENTRGGDRAFVVYFRLPVNATGWSWSSALGSGKTLGANDRAYEAFNWFQTYRTTTSASPIATLASSTAAGTPGIALAVPPTAPSIYRLSYQAPWGFQVEWEVGTAPEPQRFPNAAQLEALLYRVDAQWPYRSALKRMYLLYPDLWTKRAEDGAWTYDDASLGSVSNPEDFAMKFAETYLWSTAYTKDHGIYTMKYVEPWNDHIETSPAGLLDWAQDSAVNQVWAQISKGEPRQVTAQAALLSGVFGRDGDYAGYSDPGNFSDPEGTRRWVLNPDWEVSNFLDFTADATGVGAVLNRGKAIEEYELFRQWGQKPGADDRYDGLYLDSANTSGSGWAGWHLFNFRREHFATTRAPLVFDPQSGKVALSQALSSVETIRHLADILHERKGLIMANGMPDPFLFSTAAFCDFVSPGEYYEGSLPLLQAMRAALYTKPSSWLFNGSVTDAQFAHSLLYAIFPGGAGIEGNRGAYQRWAPLMKEVAAAGWEPLTFARSSDPGVLVERYGRLDRGNFKIVVHRESGSGGAVITLDKAALGIGPGVELSVAARVGGSAMAVTDQGETLEVPVDLAAESSEVLAFTVTAGTALAPRGEALPMPPNAPPPPPLTRPDGEFTCPPGAICATPEDGGGGDASDGSVTTGNPNAEVVGKIGCQGCASGGRRGRGAALTMIGVLALIGVSVRRRSRHAHASGGGDSSGA